MTRLSVTSRKGKLNRASMTVRLGFNHMKFDAVVEWVKAYQDLAAIKTETPSEQIEIVKVRLAALQKVFEHMFPKIKEIDQATEAIMEMEAVSEAPEAKSTEELLESVNVEDLNKT